VQSIIFLKLYILFCRLDHVLGTVGSSIGLKSVYDDDFIDRLNHYYTVIILIIFTVIISTNQYVGDPITCWCPADFTENRVDYTNFVCWVSNTYYIPMQHQIPTQIDHRTDKELTYYQWVPLILLTMALLFKIPRMAFKVFSASSGISLDRLAGLAKETQYAKPQDRHDRLTYIVKYLDQWLSGVSEYRAGMCVRIRQKLGEACCFICGRHSGNYLVTAIIFVKILYFGNCVAQLFLLNTFLGTNYNVYGFEVMQSLAMGEDWTTSPRFPRITLCDFEIRQMTNVQRWTVQCVLPINLFNEKIFIFLWFWIVLIAALSAFSVVVTIYATIFPQHRRSYMRKYLRLSDLYKKTDIDRKILRKFVESYLKQDGVYVLRAVSNNANDVIATELVKLLFEHFRQNQISKSTHNMDDNSNV